MARKKITITGDDDTRDSVELTFNGSPDSDSDKRPSKVQAKSDDNTPAPTEASGNEGTSKPYIHRKPVQARPGIGAAPIVANLAARFDPREKRVQPLEHYVYRDASIAKRGYI